MVFQDAQKITIFVQSCPICQNRKQINYEHLPTKEAEAKIWDKMRIILIGLYEFMSKEKSDLLCKCATMSDPTLKWNKLYSRTV